MIDYKGKQEGELLVELVPHQCGDMNLMADNFDDDGEWSVSDFIGKVRGGRSHESCIHSYIGYSTIIFVVLSS